MSRQTFYCPELKQDVTVGKLSRFAIAYLSALENRYRDPDKRKLAQAAYILRFGMTDPALASPLAAVQFMRKQPPALVGRLIAVILDLTMRGGDF